MSGFTRAREILGGGKSWGLLACFWTLSAVAAWGSLPADPTWEHAGRAAGATQAAGALWLLAWLGRQLNPRPHGSG